MDENINNEKNAKKKKLISQIVLTSVFGLIIIGTSLAIFFARASGGLNNITTKDLVDVTYTEGSTLRLTSNTPIFEDEIEDKATEFNFTVRNPNSTPVYASIDLSSISMSSALKSYDFKWALYDGSTKITTGSFIDAGTTLNLYNNSVINGNSSKNYKIRIWLNETGETQNLQGTSFTSKVEVTAYSRELRTLNSKILSDNTVNTKIPDFSVSNSDSGLFVLQNDSKKTNFGFPTYYFGGTVKNNYVLFGTYKEDVYNIYNDPIDGEISNIAAKAGDSIRWRIVRINEDGSIKLISVNNIGNSFHIWNSNNKPDYINSDGTSSNIKNEIDKFYNETFVGELNNKIQTGDFCNDINENTSKRYNPVNPSPIFICPDSNRIVNTKAGLITADELLFSGFTYDKDYSYLNTNSYMNNNSDFWTMTAIDYGVISYYSPYDDLDFHTINSSNVAQARLVINLKPNVLVKSGDGTAANPYIISDANL